MTGGEYLLVRQLIEQTAGLRFEDGDWASLRAAVDDRMAALGISNLGEYDKLLRTSGESGELAQLTELLTVHETAFFRNRGHFDLLERVVIPELLQRKVADRRLRFWSAGCSTGQEPYSIAISLLEAIPSLDGWQVEVLATDISERALEQARAAVYPARSLRGVDPVLVGRYFQQCKGGYRVADAVRRLVRFEGLNLVKEPFPFAALGLFDVVFCENVTIYFNVESTRRVIRNFHEVLLDGGYLFLGYSETLWQISGDFLLREWDGVFAYQKAPRSKEDAADGLPPPMAGKAAAKSGARRQPSRRLRKVAPPASRGRAVTLEGATALYEAGRLEEAVVAAESLVSSDPTNAGAHLLAAKLKADREQIGPALAHCRRALDSDPLLEEGHYLMGVLLRRAGDAQAAAASLSRVIYLNPVGRRAALAHFHLAGMHADAGAGDRAIREYGSALRLLERLPKGELIDEFSADFLAKVCRRRLDELERG